MIRKYFEAITARYLLLVASILFVLVVLTLLGAVSTTLLVTAGSFGVAIMIGLIFVKPIFSIEIGTDNWTRTYKIGSESDDD